MIDNFDVVSLMIPAMLIGLIILAQPLWGLFLVLFLSPLKTFGEEVLFLARLLGMWIVAVTIARLLAVRVKIRWIGVEEPVILVAIGMSLSFVFSFKTREVAESIISLVSLYGLSLIIFILIQNRKQLKSIVLVFLVSGILPIVQGILQGLQTHPDRTYARVSGTFTLPTGLGAFLIPIVLLAFVMTFYPKLTILMRGFILIIFGGGILALLLTLSRGSIYGALIGGIFIYLTLRSQMKYKRLTAIIIWGICIFAIWYLWPSIEGRVIVPIMEYINTGKSGDVTQRLGELSLIIPITIENNFMGTGIGNYAQSAIRYRVTYKVFDLPLVPHTILLYFFGEVGLVGAIGFLWLLGRIFQRAKSTYHLMMDMSPDIVFYVYIGSLGSLIGYISYLVTHSGFFQNEIWILMALFFVSIRLAEDKLQNPDFVHFAR